MTTTVTIETHDWPVMVTKIELGQTESGPQFTEVIPPHSRLVTHIFSTRHLVITELPVPKKD